ncbi:FAD-dependent oxidoreductase [Herbaspirillum rubrisubalbicans]|uniref:Tryptophan 2-monooxygenase n=2 Tax=Herbaspirillum TaxID=963 RepID=A0A6M3ZYW4_9BURK|nr:FAD-dependent oxidoreductase [Herbaspirillum rubrisubalbicans]QJQ03646.1 amine oxidase [Herbaspirillum rubrisubalbicans Os34]
MTKITSGADHSLPISAADVPAATTSTQIPTGDSTSAVASGSSARIDSPVAKRARLSVLIPALNTEVLTASAPAWPAGRVDMRAHLQRISGAADASPSEQAPLSTIGRPLPPLNPQSVGRYFQEVAGQWPSERADLADALCHNLSALADGPKRQQHHLEITLHWHCLSEAEKRNVLNTLGSEQSHLLGDTAIDTTPDAKLSPVRDWVEHTVVNMKPDEATRLLKSCTPTAQKNLATVFKGAGEDAQVRTMIKQRFASLRMTMPLDHMYDYTGFFWDNKRKVGELPPGVAENLKVCVVGAGPAGIIAADGLNRLGVKPVVLEQADKIGGRIAAERWPRQDGSMSPTPLHPGGMRFHTTRGNVYWSLAEHYQLQHVPFPNSSSVQTSYIIGNEVHEAEPGKSPGNAVMQKVAQDVLRSMTEPLLAPIRAARDAADTALFRELCDAAKKKFDSHNFRSGLDTLLKEKGIEWNQKEWQTFGATGIGVGGYEGYYNTGFLEEMRFLADERLEGHVALVDGADAPLYAVLNDTEDLPEGAQSLQQQQAIRLGVEVTGIKKKDGKYYVSSLDKQTQKVSVESYDELFFAGGPREAVRLGLTGPQEGSEALMPEEFANAMEKANVVGATKMAIKIAKDLMSGVELPGNVQASKLFQQSYLVPALPGSDNAVFYPSYTLGDNATKVAGMSGDEQLNNYIRTLRDIASQNPGDAVHQKLKNLADVVEQSKQRISYTHWSLTKHQYGAFKMDAPNQLDNTRVLFGALLKMSDGAIFINEENTAEGGFASGAVAAAINGLQQMVLRRGGSVPPHSPFHQELL